MKSLLFFPFFLIVITGSEGLPLEPGEQSKSNAINCTPADGWQVIFTYRNGMDSAAGVSYLRSVGTQWESGTPSAADATAFFQKFADVLGK